LLVVRLAAAVGAASFVLMGGCVAESRTVEPPSTFGAVTGTTPLPTSTTATSVVATGAPTTSTTAAQTSTGPTLVQLRIDDSPTPAAPYRRDDWPTWLDLDGDGCDAREQVLRETSVVPAVVVSGCGIGGGRWVSSYDGVTFTSASQLDIDHVVSLEQAHRSGGWQWTPQQRTVFANDISNLVPVSASSNRSKGSATPDEWRPAQQNAWCSFASTYVAVKVAYGLSVTTSERDALGQMLETCPNP
jgi:hypothetical protein